MLTLIVVLIAVAAIAAVMLPLLRPVPDNASAPEEGGDTEAELDAYRAAARAGTLCDRCGRANPEGSRHCMECGARLGRQRRRRA